MDTESRSVYSFNAPWENGGSWDVEILNTWNVWNSTYDGNNPCTFLNFEAAIQQLIKLRKEHPFTYRIRCRQTDEIVSGELFTNEN